MARLILHIGTHKTATTTIQNSFHANRKLLAKHGLIYPDLGRAEGHHGLVADWTNLPATYHYPQGAAATWQQVVKKYARGDHTVFLSSEELSRGNPKTRLDLKLIRSWLEPFDEIKVICSLRDQVAFVQSIYLEISKRKAPPFWGPFLNNCLKTGYATGLFMDYTALDDHLLTAFSADEIHYVDYASAARGTGILAHMLALTGCGLDADALAQSPETSAANVSPDPLASWVSTMVARPDCANHPLRALVREKLHGDVGDDRKTTLYVRSEVDRLRAKTAPLNAALHERLATRQPDFRLTPTEFAEDTIYRSDLKTSFWIALSSALHKQPA